MTTMPQSAKYIDRSLLPLQFPTQRHTPEFWEHLGRVIATFGSLEEILAKAIFAITATTEYSEKKIHVIYEKWPELLKRTLSDTLVPLAETYAKAVKEHHEADFANIETLVEGIKKAAAIRNVLCHGSWREPNAEGKSIPFFINKHDEMFDAQIDIQWLRQLHTHLQDLICSVINSVTVMGWKFPGSVGDGKEIYTTG